MKVSKPVRLGPIDGSVKVPASLWRSLPAVAQTEQPLCLPGLRVRSVGVSPGVVTVEVEVG